MDTSEQIIRDLRVKVGFETQVDFLNMCKGIPVVFKGSIKEFTPDSIIFEVTSPDSICLKWYSQTLILHDIFISAIQSTVRSFNITSGLVELADFTYVDRGFGQRSMVRVEPDEPFEILLDTAKGQISGIVMDVSLNGFGIQVEALKSGTLSKGDPVTLKTHILDKDLEIPGQILNNFMVEDHQRLAISFEHDAPGHAIVARYITRRRAEIRKEITDAYQKSIGENA